MKNNYNSIIFFSFSLLLLAVCMKLKLRPADGHKKKAHSKRYTIQVDKFFVRAMGSFEFIYIPSIYIAGVDESHLITI